MLLTEISERLQAFITDEFDTGTTLNDLTEADGHAGLAFLFSVTDRIGVLSHFVLKMPPKGVRYSGNSDVYRQAVLMRALQQSGLPVPRVPWAFEANERFETPFIAVERMPGNVFFVWDSVPEFSRSVGSGEKIWRQCIEQLPAIDDFSANHALIKSWDEIEPLSDNVLRWQRIYRQAPQPQWVAAAERGEYRLAATIPSGDPIGLFHGDYLPGNILYVGTQLSGIIDWELAGRGALLQDVGWSMTVCDPAN